MFNNGLGGMGGNGDFEALARQYWGAWGDAMRQGGLGTPTVKPVNSQWQQAVNWWSQLMPGGHSQANDAVGRFNRQASDWFGQMQQVAAQFSGQDSSANDISQAWRRALGANAENPLLDMLKGMRGPGAHGLDEWLEQVQPYLDGLQQQAQRWQQLPAFGQYREHQERLQALQLAQQEYKQQSDVFNKLMMRCLQQAFEVFEDKLVAHEEPGRQITTARALFDLWIDSAEQAYAEVALSQEFREVYGALTNAQMRLRAAIQREVEHMTGLFGMPSRTEVDSAHRKIAELERALRRAKASENAVPRSARKTATPASTQKEVAVEVVPETPTPVTKPATKRRAKKSVPARKLASRKPTARKSAVASKKAVSKRAISSKLGAKPAVATAKPGKRKAGKKVVTSKVLKARALPKNTVKPAVKKPEVRKPAVKKILEKSGAAKNTAQTTGSGQVVSMKDWVARYAAASAGDSSAKQKKTAGKGARK